MIRDASTMDKLIDHEPDRRRRWTTLASAAAVLVVGGILLAPAVGRWASSEISVPRAQVRTATVERGDLVREVSADGRIVAGSHPTTYSPAQGIVAVLVEAGEVVERGRPLARIDSPELTSRLDQERATLAAIASDHERLLISDRQRSLEDRQDVELAEVRLAAAERALDRTRRLFDLGLVNEIDLEAARDQVTIGALERDKTVRREEMEREMRAFGLEDASQRLERQRLLVADLERQVEELEVRSPVDGLVSRLHVDDRQAVSRHDALVTVVDLSALEVEAAVAENLADEVVPGTPAVITIGGAAHDGVVTSVSPEVEGSRVRCRLAFAGAPPDSLRQNQRVDVRLVLETRHDVVKVPRGPWLEAGAGRRAWVVAGDLAELRPIEAGATSVSEVEILSGLEPDEEIVISDTSRFEDARSVLLR